MLVLVLALVLAFTCGVNGSRLTPVSRALVGVAVTLTAGNAGTGALADPATGVGATGMLLLAPLEIKMGTAMSATTSAAAIGHRCF